jgi:hypothetical protein
MKNNYEAPIITLIALQNQDILTASAGDSEIFDMAW